MITLACVSTLYTAQPYRQSTDNTVAVLGQALVYSWTFMLLLRIVRVGEGGATVVGGVALVAATFALFAFALYAIRSDLRKAAVSAKGTPSVVATGTPSVATSEDEGFDDKTSSTERECGGNSPLQETGEIEVNVVSIDERSAVLSNMESPWQLLGLCAAEPDITADTHGSNEVAVLLARLDAMAKLIREKDDTMREKDKTIREKDKEIARLVADG